MVYKRNLVGREVRLDEALKRVLPNPNPHRIWTKKHYRLPVTIVEDDLAVVERIGRVAFSDLMRLAQLGRIKLYGEKLIGHASARREKIPPRSCLGARLEGRVNGFVNAKGEVFENIWVSRADLEREYPLGKSEVNISNQPDKNTGPKPVARENVKSKMRRDIEEGRITVAKLEGMKGKEMISHYGFGRETCCKAREQVLSEMATNGDTIKISTH